MKAAAFAWAPPGSLSDAIRLLQPDDARALAGGQSLGPMLNLRAARPGTVVPLAALPELHGAEDAADALTLGPLPPMRPSPMGERRTSKSAGNRC